jgi:hypothetical protein
MTSLERVLPAFSEAIRLLCWHVTEGRVVVTMDMRVLAGVSSSC